MKDMKDMKDIHAPFTLARQPKLMPSQAEARPGTRLENAVLSRPAGPPHANRAVLHSSCPGNPAGALFFSPCLCPRTPSFGCHNPLHPSSLTSVSADFPVGSIRRHPKRLVLVQPKSPTPFINSFWEPLLYTFFMSFSLFREEREVTVQLVLPSEGDDTHAARKRIDDNIQRKLKQERPRWMVRLAAWPGEGGLWSPVPAGPKEFALYSVSRTGESTSHHTSARDMALVRHGGPPRGNTFVWVAARSTKQEAKRKERKKQRKLLELAHSLAAHSSQLTAHSSQVSTVPHQRTVVFGSSSPYRVSRLCLV
jgi:hypothetical protein